MTDEIAPQIRSMMRDEELENMQNRDGWSRGGVTLFEYGRIERSLDGAWIELFNGEGRAGEFGGVKFMWVGDEAASDAGLTGLIENDLYEEAYAYGSIRSLAESTNNVGWAVSGYEDVSYDDVGKMVP